MSTPTTIDFLIESIRLTQNTNTTKEKPTDPCGSCARQVKHNDKAIFCSVCLHWIHIKCNGISVDEYKFRMKRNRDNPDSIENDKWTCLNCVIAERSDTFPLGWINNYELSCLNSSDSVLIAEMIPEFHLASEALSINNLNNKDIDENLVDNINCKYYTFKEFSNLRPSSGSFNIFHSNVNGYECHSDNVHKVLASSGLDFHAICLSETSQKLDQVFSPNSMIQGYHNPFCTPTNSRNGGVAIFIKDIFDVIEREDCNVKLDEFESVWIEIKQKKCKNIVIGCLYRHPHYSNIDDFSSYVESTLNKLNKENKEVYITGDFNIDLLKYNSISKHQEFYNLMTANGYLPQIIQPTRITETTMTIIDNIYTNTFNNDIISGNLLVEIADHLVQFVSVTKQANITSEHNYYKRSYKNWNEQSFLDDLSIQNWSSNHVNANDSYNDFIWRLKGCIDRHAPLKN